MKDPVLYMVIPCYNEQEVLPDTAPLFQNKLNSLIASGKISENSRIMFVNDGSTDSTWEIIKELSEKDEHCIGISQSRNRGHQSTVLAGLMEAIDKCDITISIDCDGQDDINAMDRMIDAYAEGSEVVYGVRNNRESDTFFKRFTAESFYKGMKILGCDVVFNHADYRLISNKVLHELAGCKEVNLFLRGLIPLIGFKSTSVYYSRYSRIAGSSHYPLSKMLSLSWEAVTSLSIKPVRLILLLGLFFVFLSVIGVIYGVIAYQTDNTIAGWTSIVCLICLIGGFQILSIGIIGEYIGKIYLETKCRPRYIISERTWQK